jgi:hypothetical protein
MSLRTIMRDGTLVQAPSGAALAVRPFLQEEAGEKLRTDSARLCPLARQKKRGRVRLTHTPLQERVSHVYPARADHTRVALL